MADLPTLRTVRSGGQTGVDRAALDAALAAGLQAGGWCPRGRLAEDGRIPAYYRLVEAPTADPADRTCRNVRDADATLILSRSSPTGGTALTAEEARRLQRPLLLVDVASASPDSVARWLRERKVRDLNVAGPRESEVPGIYAQAKAFLSTLFSGGV